MKLNCTFSSMTITDTTVIFGKIDDEVIPYSGTIKKLSETRFEVRIPCFEDSAIVFCTSFYSGYEAAVKEIKASIRECYERSLF